MGARVCVCVSVHASAGTYSCHRLQAKAAPGGDSAVSGVFIKPSHFLELSIIMKNTHSPKLNAEDCKSHVFFSFFDSY